MGIEHRARSGTGLPDSVIGYDAIDTILWCDADPTQLKSDQLTALEDFVRRGGKLVISQDTRDEPVAAE